MIKIASERTVKKRGAERNAGSSVNKRFRFSLGRAKRALAFLGFGGVLASVTLLAIMWMPPVKQFFSIPMTNIEFVGYTGGEFVGANTGGVSEEELLELAIPLIGGSYWQLSVEKIKQAVETHPWVRRATVSKRWPAIVVVGVDEYVPIARWNEQVLMSMTGELFEVSNVTAYSRLPHFKLNWGDSENPEMVRGMVERYNRYQNLLEPLSLQITQMGLRTLDDVWLSTEGGLRIELGSQNHEQRLQRMVQFCLQQGVESLQAWKSIDLRYAKGISVSEKVLASKFHTDDVKHSSSQNPLQLTGRG